MKLPLLGALATFATAWTLHLCLQGPSWIGTVLLAIGVAVAGCGLGRATNLPRLVVPFVGLAALVLALTQMFAREVAIWGVLPGPGSARAYLDLLSQAMTEIHDNAAPIEVTTPILALLAGGIGLIALLVDSCAVTYRAAAAAGIPLLALYGVPVAVLKDGVPWPYFLLAAIPWLVLVLVDHRDRSTTWGRLVGRGEDEARTTGPMVGRRIATAALGIALVVPVLVPFIGDGRLNPTGVKGAGSRVITVNPYVSIQSSLKDRSDGEVLVYQTTAEAPSYISLVPLDKYEDGVWKPVSLSSDQPATDEIPAPPGGSAGAPVVTEFQARELTKSTWLPAGQTLVSVSVDGEWVLDQETRTVWSPDGDLRDERWRTTSADPTLTADKLADATSVPREIIEQYTALPDDLDPRIHDYAKAAVDPSSSELEQLIALQRLFRQQFTYDAEYEGDKDDPIGSFLQEKRGFCQQFAGTFAVLARSLGFPTRVMVGFLPGALDETGGAYSVHWTDTHAWPEVYFGGIGWVRFEPTPRGQGGVRIPAYTAVSSNVPNDIDPGPFANIPTHPDPKDLREPTSGGNTDTPSGPSLLDRAGDVVGAIPWQVLGVLLLAALALAIPSVTRVFTRRRRIGEAARGTDPQAATDAAWAELQDTCTDLGRPWPSSQTPRQTTAELAADLGSRPQESLQRIGRLTEQARYARGTDTLSELDVDLTVVLDGLLDDVDTKTKWRARLLPRSTVRGLTERMADGMDRLDAAVARLRRRR